MTQHRDPHDELRDLLTDAVEDVEPQYRLDTIRARTRRAHPRRTWFTVGGAVLAAASVVTAVSVANDDGPRRVGPAGPDRTSPTALYFVGETPAGPRLYREFQELSGDPLAALQAITTAGGADDPDYDVLWPDGWFESVDVTSDAIVVELGPWNGPTYEIAPAVVRLYVQQVVYTAQAATGAQLPVLFEQDGEPVDDLIGVLPLGGPVDRAPQNDVLNPMSISDPVEGLRVTDSLIARGRANSHEANVLWEIRAADGTSVMEGFTTAEGTFDHLYPWETEPIDVSDLEPGRYEFVAMTEDPSGGEEGFGSFTDTRTIIVE
jgi:hypothetical protein